MSQMLSYLNKNPYQQEDQLEDPIQLMTANLMKIKKQMNNTSNDPPVPNSTRQQVIEQYVPQVHQNDIIIKQYEAFLDELPEQFNTMKYQEKIQFLMTKSETGALVILFEIVYHFRDALSQDILIQIAKNITQNMRFDNQVELRCAIQLLGLLGVVDQNMVQTISKMMLEEEIPFDLGFLYLINMGYLGLFTLIDIANKDFNDIPLQILDHLARSESIIEQIIIPILFQDLANNDPKKRVVALCAINRMNNLLKDPKYIAQLERLLQQGAIDRGLLASTIRSTGEIGEEILLKSLRGNHNKSKIPIISVLPWKVPVEPELSIKVIEYTLGSNFSMYKYEGSLEPSAYLTERLALDELILNSRDLMAALHRMLTNKYQTYENQMAIRQASIQCKDLFLLVDIMKQKEEGEMESQLSVLPISTEVIKSLGVCLNNSVPEIREAALNALGVIGMPEATEALEKVIKCLSDSDSRNRSMACWALSKLCENPSQKIIKKLVELLKDSYWKVRTSACIAIGTIVKIPNEFVIQALLKAMKDGTINKNTVCETMIRLGSVGQEILVELLKHTHKSDFKMKTAIINSFKFADVTQPTIDFLIEELFKHSHDENVQVRALCLESLIHLRNKSKQQNITYLKAKNILPLFYQFLEDGSQRLRDLAVQAILSFGAQAELIFIEGLTKNQNPLVRAQSAKALCRLGVQNFRAIIFGLRDQDERVRKATASGILSNFTKELILQEFRRKQNQIPSLVCHIKDIMNSSSFTMQLKQIFQELIHELEPKNRKHISRHHTNKQNEDHNIEEY